MSPSARHQWGLGVAPILGDHSAAKHEILSEYIQKYLRIVCSRHQMRKFDITIVDGFAGGGIYKEDKPGSPLVIIGAVNKARIDINKDRKNPIDINPEYFFIEKDPDNFESLSEVFRDHPDSQFIHTINNDFHWELDRIIDAVKKKNPKRGGGVIFFLDQEGYTAVNMRTIDYIKRELPKSEIILTFAISNLIDFISEPELLRQQADKIGLRHLNVDEICHIKDYVVDYRNIIESKFSEAISKSTSFQYYRPFFVEPQGNHRGYWLLHLAQNYRAHNAMTEATWKSGNSMRHYGGVGTRALEVFYKGRYKGIPSIFGDTFTDEAWSEHREGLVTDLARIVWKYENINVEQLIESTCNDTAAPPEMYLEALSNNNEIVVLGKSGGNKRGGKVSLSDILKPRRQKLLLPF